MYTPRKLGAPGARRDSNYPTPYQGTPPGSPLPHSRTARRRLGIPFVRTRIHPLFLIPVFLVGAYFSPFKGGDGDGRGDLRYTGPAYREDYGGDKFLPPDAPPLARELDQFGGAGKRLKKGGAVQPVKVAEKKLAEDEDEGELWDFNYQPEDDDQATATPHLVERDGYLYYPHSSAIPLVSISIPPAVRLALPPSASSPPLTSDEILTAPPAPPPWHAPGAHINPFASPAVLEAPLGPPAQREIGARAAAQRAQRAAEAAAAAAAAAPAAGAPPGGRAVRKVAGKQAPVVEVGPQGQRLGPNAAAMAKAAREGKPFRPKRPVDLIYEAKRLEAERRRKKEAEELDRKNGWEPVKARGRFAADGGAARKELQEKEELKKKAAAAAAVVVPAPVVGGPGGRKVVAGGALDVDDDDDDDDEADDDDGEGHSLDDEDEEDLSAEDQEIIDALMALSPEQRKVLSPEELELIAEIELERAEAAAAAPPPVAAKARGARIVKGGGAGRWTGPKVLDLNQQARQAVNLKPVFRGKLPPPAPAAARQKRPKARGPRADLKKAQPVPRPPMKLRKRAAIPEEEPAVNTDSPPPSTEPHLVPRAEIPSPPDSPSSKSPPAPPPDRLHPIAKLIADAEERWEDMLRRQSQTLEHAVFEYQRRYGRKPPLGFDKWWRYAMENRVILVDEYDQINDDITPFFALSSTEVRARAEALAEDNSLPHYARSFSLAIKDGSIHASGPGAKSDKSEDMQDIMSEFAEVLPDMTLTFASHYEPSVAISGEARDRHLRAARDGKILTRQESFEVLENPGYTPFHGLCMPNSTARRHADGRPLDPKPTGPSFVSLDHTPAMDLCTHPELKGQHGFTAWEGPRPYLLYPLFSSSKTTMHGDLLCAPFDEYFAEVGRDPVWERKKHNKVMWRGQSNGVYHDRVSGWRSTHRARLVHMANDVEGTREVRFADPSSANSLRRFIGPTNAINEHYFDIAYANNPTQCEELDGTCEIMHKELRFVPSMTKDAGNEYKYVLDVDGNGWSDRFHRLMLSSSLVFKSTIFPEWWTRRVVPWYHYVPIKSDYSDLTDAAAFFIGVPDGTGAHDALGKKLALNGKKWAQEHWRETDMAAYQLRLYLEFSRLINRDDKGSHDFTLN